MALIAAVALTLAAPAQGSVRLSPERNAVADEAARAAAYWTPARMRAAQPLRGPALPDAAASFVQIKDPTTLPNAVNGRLFLKQGGGNGFCSATAINSPSRSLILTAGHCVNSGPRGRQGNSAWSHQVLFVPAYSGSDTPFGIFTAYRKDVFAPRQWVRFGNPNYDFGAIVVRPNEAGVAVADAVGGATIALDRPRKQHFETFGYPGRIRWMQGCRSPYDGDDPTTFRLPGPPTISIRCHWAPGASGGGWLIDGGTTINGLTSYAKGTDRLHTYGPYFSERTVGRLVAGL